MYSAPTIIISRFILDLRRSDLKARAADSHFSHFMATGIQFPTIAAIAEEMGQTLEHGDQVERFDEDHTDVDAISTLAAHSDIEGLQPDNDAIRSSNVDEGRM